MGWDDMAWHGMAWQMQQVWHGMAGAAGVASAAGVRPGRAMPHVCLPCAECAERACGADDGADCEGGEVSHEAERQEDEDGEEHNHEVAARQQRGSTYQLSDGGEAVAHDDRVGERAAQRLERDGEGRDDRGGLAEDLGPRVAVRVGAHRVADACDRREGIARH